MTTKLTEDPVTPGAMKQDTLWDWRMKTHEQVWIAFISIIISETIPEHG